MPGNFRCFAYVDNLWGSGDDRGPVSEGNRRDMANRAGAESCKLMVNVDMCHEPPPLQGMTATPSDPGSGGQRVLTSP